MSRLTIYSDKQAEQIQLQTEFALEISELLADYGIVFKQRPWQGSSETLMEDKEQQSDLKRDIVPFERHHQFPFQTLVLIDQEYPNYERLRLKYLSEYSIDKDQVLYLLEGRLLLSFHLQEQVIRLLCQAGDVLIMPGGVAHWLDMGEGTERICMLLCTQQHQEPILHYSGSNIADLFARLQ